MATLLNTRFTNYIGSGTGSPPSGSGDARGAIKVYLESQNSSTNQSYIRIDHLVRTSLKSGVSERLDITSSYRCNNGSYGGTYQSKSKTQWTIPYDNGYHTIGTTYHYVDHSTDGSATLYVNGSISGQSAWYTSFNRTSAFSVALPTIPRATTITSFTWAKASGAAGISRLTCGWSTANAIDRIQYSLNGGSYTTVAGSGTSGSFNINGLTPNTAYSLKIKVRRADSQVETESSVKSATTYDVAKITGAGSSYTINMGDAFNVAYTNPSGAKVEMGIYKTDGMTAIAGYRTMTASPYTYTPTTPETNAMYNLIPTKSSIILRIYLRTSDGLGNTYVSSSVERTFQVINANPTFTTWTYADTNAATLALTGNSQKIIKGYSNVKATITSANKMVAIKSATPIRYQLTIGAKNATANYSSNSTVEMTINAVDNNVFTVYAIDSRENSTPVSKTASTYINYSPISIAKAKGTRTDGIGTQTTLTYNGTFFNASFGSVTNTIKSATYKFKKTTDANYTDGTSIITPTLNGNTFSFSGLIKGDKGDGGVEGFDATYSYNIQVIVTDELSTHTFNFILGTGTPNIAIHQNGVAINQAYDETLGGALQVNGAINSIDRVTGLGVTIKNDGDNFIDFRTAANVRKGYLGYIPSIAAMALYNHNSGKSLKLKDDASIVYDDKRILTTDDLPRHIITANITADKTIAQTNTVEVLNWVEKYKVGTKLTVANNKITVGAGVSYVLVSGKLEWSTIAGNGIKSIYIMKNGITQYFNSMYMATTDDPTNTIFPPTLVPVAANDTIEITVYGTQNDVFLSGRSYMTVEVVA